MIVNADYWGYSPPVTDVIMRWFDAGMVTSTTAMMWMRDTQRAAEIARDRRLPVGLHLNLTAPFEARVVPERVRERQLAIVGHFAPDSWRMGAPFTGDPLLLSDVIRDQLDAFYELFGEPTHIDGHHHIHVHPAVLSLLPPDIATRPMPREPGALLAPDSERDRTLRATHPAPEVAVELPRLHARLGTTTSTLRTLAASAAVEIVTHPIADGDLLGSATWREATAGLKLDSYRALSRPDARPLTDAPQPCPICGSTTRVDYHDRPNAVCASCGALERQRALARVLSQHVVQTAEPTCLEIGPRNAVVFGEWLRGRGWRYAAVDKWSMRGRSDPEALGSYIEHDADLSDLHFATSGSVDLFLLQHVLEEVRDYRSALDEISRILTASGTAYLEIPWTEKRADSHMKPPDVYENLWSFGADLLDELRARFATVDVIRLTEDRYRGDCFVCRHA
jgi:hypothetical protein